MTKFIPKVQEVFGIISKRLDIILINLSYENQLKWSKLQRHKSGNKMVRVIYCKRKKIQTINFLKKKQPFYTREENIGKHGNYPNNKNEIERQNEKHRWNSVKFSNN